MFLHPFCLPVSFYRGIILWILIGINEQCLLNTIISVLLLVVVMVMVGVCSTFDLLVWNYLILVFSWVGLSSLGWSFPSSTFCRVAFVNRYCLNLILLWNVLFSSYTILESFARYGSLPWHLWSFTLCRTSVKVLWSLESPMRSQVLF